MHNLWIFFTIIALGVTNGFAAITQEMCPATEQTTEEVKPGVILTWDSAFHCADAPEEGGYAFTVVVENDESSTTAVNLETLMLHQITPRPWGQEPYATGSTGNLPLVLAPGESGSFIVSGDYLLVHTGQSAKVNLHFLATGYEAANDEPPFHLSFNAIIRGGGVVQDDDDEDDNDTGDGPPSWVPGPPPWAGGEDDDEEEDEEEDEDDTGDGPPSGVPGPPPWAGGEDDDEEDEDDTGGGPPFGVPGPPPWAGQEDENDGGTRNGPPSWAPGSPPFAAPGE